MQQYAQAAKGLIANVAKDLKELKERLPEVLEQLQTGDPLGALTATAAAAAVAGPSGAAHAAAAPQQPQARADPLAGAARRAADAGGAAVTEAARVSQFKDVLLGSRIDLRALRRLAFSGVPDRDGLRAITWKLLLGYLPADPSGWDELLARKRTEYVMFCEELIVDPKKKAAEVEAGGGNPLGVPLARVPGQQQQKQQQQQEEEEDRPASGSGRRSSTGGGGGGGGAAAAGGTATSGAAAGAAAADPLGGPLTASSSNSSLQGGGGDSGGDAARQRKLQGQDAADHPLALHSTSVWNTFFKDSEVMEQIDRDVMRTHPDMHFFSGDSEEAETHRKEMKRALFLYAKLNPGLRYIQGMNELLAPLYYAFKTDTDKTNARYAEADAFYCFVELLVEFRDLFCQQLDNSTSGIRATIARLMALLKAIDPQLAEHLEKNKVNPQFFAFRWITLLLTQEFPFPDAVRIWDTLLSDPRGRLDCLLRVCLALLMHAPVRARLLAGDFADNVKLLQRYPSVDVSEILRAAAALPPCDDIVGPPGAPGGAAGPL